MYPYQTFPFCYVLMDYRTTKAYKTVFDYITKNAYDLTNVDVFSTDY